MVYAAIVASAITDTLASRGDEEISSWESIVKMPSFVKLESLTSKMVGPL